MKRKEECEVGVGNNEKRTRAGEREKTKRRNKEFELAPLTLMSSRHSRRVPLLAYFVDSKELLYSERLKCSTFLIIYSSLARFNLHKKLEIKLL